MRAKIDLFDRRILALLQEDATLPMTELARRVGLSTSPCWRRVRRLTEAGVIKRQMAVLDRHLLGLDFVVYAYVKLAGNSRKNLQAFEAEVVRWPEVVQCELMTGAADYLIKVVVADVVAYDRFLRDQLLADGLVSEVQSRIVVATIKDAAPLPLVE
jgi:Lrp/AsnC family transcriptional regulator